MSPAEGKHHTKAFQKQALKRKDSISAAGFLVVQFTCPILANLCNLCSLRCSLLMLKALLCNAYIMDRDIILWGTYLRELCGFFLLVEQISLSAHECAPDSITMLIIASAWQSWDALMKFSLLTTSSPFVIWQHPGIWNATFTPIMRTSSKCQLSWWSAYKLHPGKPRNTGKFNSGAWMAMRAECQVPEWVASETLAVFIYPEFQTTVLCSGNREAWDCFLSISATLKAQTFVHIISKRHTNLAILYSCKVAVWRRVCLERAGGALSCLQEWGEAVRTLAAGHQQQTL